MPRSDFVQLIVRLAIGLLVLGFIGALVYFRLRKPPTKQVTENPSPSASAVVIVTPTPIPSVATLPTVQPTSNPSSSGNQAPRTVTQAKPIVKKAVIITKVSTAQSGTSAQASASSGTQSAATAQAGNAYAYASAGNGSASAIARSQ